MNTPRQSWQHRWFGVWQEYGEAYRRCPSITDFICPGTLTDHEKKKVAHYLDNAHLVVTTSRTQFPCAISGHRHLGSISFRTDGHWLWLDDLSHYVVEHDVCIPSQMLEAIRVNGFEPPEVTDKQVQELEWPPAGN